MPRVELVTSILTAYSSNVSPRVHKVESVLNREVILKLVETSAYQELPAVLAQTTNFSLYANGTGLTPGLRLFYGDGQAYVGPKAPSFVSQAVNITLAEQGDKYAFVVTPERTMSWTAQPSMMVDMNSDAFEPVEFIFGNETAATSSSASGFGLYGGWAFHKNEAGTVEMKFYATKTNESDIYLIRWNSKATKSVDGISVSLRTLAPVAITA
ncbi:hypothetical protein BDV96DRAFT_631925 [Lophiotrema nucula]|uniref:Uncharacterized protein n=1 Tax=Lophiotrema nucula TaxID=690887 RepID=A0A6A5Z700_9PLEO|nr:hypothetical protein BDV96DRAFT_631925 [Lophiotrema nucula]